MRGWLSLIRGVSIERQRHHVIHDKAGEQVSGSPVLPPGPAQDLVHDVCRHNTGQDTQQHMSVEVLTVDDISTLPGHGWSLRCAQTSLLALSTGAPYLADRVVRRIRTKAY